MKVTVLTKKLLGASVVTKSRTGFLVALVAIITVVGKEAMISVDFLSRNDVLVCVGVGLLGVAIWVVGRFREPKQVEAPRVQDPVDGEITAEHPLGFLGSLKYWGLILVLSAGMLSCLTTWRHRKPSVIARARAVPVTTVTVTNIVTITNVAAPLVFPSLELQGVVINGPKSSAVINGHVLCLGEGISNAMLVWVDSEHAVMAMEGQTNILALRK